MAFYDDFNTFDTGTWTLFGTATYDSTNNRVQLNSGTGSTIGRVEYDAGVSASNWSVHFTFTVGSDGADEVDLNFQVSSYQNAGTPNDGFRVHYDHYNDNVALEEYTNGTVTAITTTAQAIGAGTHTGTVAYNSGTVKAYFNDAKMFETSITPKSGTGFSYTGRDGGVTGAHYLEDTIQIDGGGSLNYEWYDTSTYYANNSHPTSAGQLDNFFNSANSGVNFGGSGTWTRDAIDWGDASQAGAGGTADAKHSYLPADGFSWKVEGYIVAPETGTYTIGVDGDDADDVFINGQQTAYWYGGHGFSGGWTAGTGQNTGTISLTKGETYAFRARMEEGGGGDGIQVGWQKPSDTGISLIPSAYLTTTPPSVPPDAPSSLSVTNVTSSQVDLSWNDNSNNEDGFYVYRSTTSGSTTGDYTRIDTLGINTTSYSDTAVSEKTTYYYRVSAFNSDGESALTNEVNASVPSSVSGTVTLNGNPVQGATVYVIDTTNGDLEATATTDASGNYDIDVPGGLTVHVTVRYDDGSTKYTDETKPYVTT